MDKKNISKYLEYNLKFIDKEGEIHILDHYNIDWLCENAKPLLKPLSDLIQKITIDGRIFIPLVQLKEGGTDNNIVFYNDFKNCYVVEDNEEHRLSFYLDSKSFHRFYRGEYRTHIDLIGMYEKLHEWHFDLYDIL